MKPTMLLALSFLYFALTAVAQPIPAYVLDINGDPVLNNSQYYIGQYYNLTLHSAGLSGNRVYLYDDAAKAKLPVIISQENRSKVVVDTALEIRFNVTPPCGSAYWKVVLESPYSVTIGGCLEGYTFALVETGVSYQYHLTYSTISPFCYNATTVDIGDPDNYLVANDTRAFNLSFYPVTQDKVGIRTPPPKWMNLLRTTY